MQLRGVTPGTAGGRGRGQGQGVKSKNDHQRRNTRPRRSRTFTTMSYASSTSRVSRQLVQSTSYYRPGGRMLLPTSSQQNIPSHSSWPWTQPPRRFFSNSRRRFDSTGIATGGSSIPPASEATEPRLQLTFTCTVESCSERSTHEFTKRAYETGIVLVTCPKCKNRFEVVHITVFFCFTQTHFRHLIADHIGWFKESTFGGQLKTVEDLMRAKGEKVTRGRLGPEGVVQFVH